MSGSFGEMGSLLKQAQEMQRELDRVRAELRVKTFEGSAGGGVVKIWVSGDRQVTKVELSPEVFKDGDKRMLEDVAGRQPGEKDPFTRSVAELFDGRIEDKT